MAKVKKHLSREEEFQIMKLVMDKFLWLGVFIMGFGFYKLIATFDNIWNSLLIMLAGVVIMLLFMWLLIREYNFMK